MPWAPTVKHQHQQNFQFSLREGRDLFATCNTVAAGPEGPTSLTRKEPTTRRDPVPGPSNTLRHTAPSVNLYLLVERLRDVQRKILAEQSRRLDLINSKEQRSL